MTAYDGTYVYIPEAERARIAQRERKKVPRAAPKKKRVSKANMKKAAAQVTASRRASNIVAGLSIAGLGIVGLWAMPKLLHQHGPDNAPTASAMPSVPASQPISIPRAYALPAAKAKPAIPAVPVVAPAVSVPAVRNDVLEAQRIISTPMTAAEKHAKPFVDRMYRDPKTMELFNSVSATTGTPVARLMEVSAAETSGKPGNPLQVTMLQFPKLLTTYGQDYAGKMETYAGTLSKDKAQPILDEAAELRSVSQLYAQYLHKALGKKKLSALQKRMDKLYKNEYVRTGMQALSNDDDRARVQKLVGNNNPQQIFGTDAIPRLTNYLGFPGVKRLWGLGNKDDLPVIHNLMSPKTAEANKVAYHIQLKEIVTKLHKHIVKKIKIPFTIGELKEKQLAPWNGADEGFQGQLDRHEARRTLMSQGSPIPQAPKPAG